MKRVQSRAELKKKILLMLGHPYINVNLSDEHLDMAIDNSLRQFFKYSPYGSFENFYIYQVTAQDVTNNYIPVPKGIEAVVEIVSTGTSISDLSFATAEYQMSRETFMAAQRFNNVSLVDYVTLKQRLYNTQQIISPAKGFEYVRFQRRLIPYFTLKEGHVLALKVYENVDPEMEGTTNPNTVMPAEDVWDDEILKEMSVAEAKKIWGSILKKFGSVVLPGGVTLDGQKMFDEGAQEFKELAEELMYKNPVDFFMG